MKKERDTHEYRLRHNHYTQLNEMIAEAVYVLEQYTMAAREWDEYGNSLLVKAKKEELRKLLKVREMFEKDYILPMINKWEVETKNKAI